MSKIGTGLFGSIFGSKKVEDFKVEVDKEENENILIRELKNIISGNKGFNYVAIDLGENDRVISLLDNLIYMKGNVKRKDIEFDEVKNVFSKTFKQDHNTVISYTGEKSGGVVAFSSDFIGDIVKLLIKKDESYIISRNSFLCSSHNIDLLSSTKAIHLIGNSNDDKFVLPMIRAKEGSAQVWLSSYGSFQGIELKSDETIIIDNGIFLAASSKMEYEIVKLNKMYKSSMFGAEGIGMKFTGPGIIFIQSKNLNNIGKMITHYINTVGKSTDFDIINDMVLINTDDKIIESNNEVIKKTKKKRNKSKGRI